MSVYGASMDAFVGGLTLGLGILLGGAAAGLGWAGLALPLGGYRLLLGAGALICAAILVGAWAWSPRSFRIADDAIIVDRAIGDVRVPLADVRSVEASDAWLGLSVKKLPGGNSGLFGIYGRFHTAELGDYDMYGRRAGNTVILHLSEGTVVLTPDEPARFAAEVQAKLSPAGA